MEDWVLFSDLRVCSIALQYTVQHSTVQDRTGQDRTGQDYSKQYIVRCVLEVH
jgi:hypothetical protein